MNTHEYFTCNVKNLMREQIIKLKIAYDAEKTAWNKNIIISFSANILISFTVIFVTSILGNFVLIDDSSLAFSFGVYVVFLLIFCPYVLVGMRFIKVLKSIKNTYISISVLSIFIFLISVVINILMLFFYRFGNFGYSILGYIYIYANPISFPFAATVRLIIPYFQRTIPNYFIDSILYSISAFLPSTGLLIGIKLKMRD